MTFKKITAIAAALSCAAAMTANASAANIVFKGNAGTENAGKSAVVAIYDSQTDISNVKSADIRYIEQFKVGSDGVFRISMPLAVSDMTEGKLVSNVTGGLFSSEVPLYCSASGTENGDGTLNNPYTFQKALSAVEDKGTVIVNGSITLPADFEWLASDKTITVSGINDAAIDIKTVDNLNINCNVTFENLVFDCSATVSASDAAADNAINANGYHVIIKDTVDTTAVLAIRGGSTSKAVDSTNLEVYGGSYRTIYGGGSAQNVNGDCRLVVGGNVNKNFKGKLKEGFPKAVIHGGSWGGIVKGDCITTVTGDASAAYVYGGTNGQKTSHVEGKIQVNVEGGNWMNVYSACYITEGKSINSEVNMKGGTVEGIFASDKPISGNVAINVTGGTVTRRIFSGCYNNYDIGGWEADNHVSGTSTLTIYPGATLMTDHQIGSGIFGGSRHDTNFAEEVSTLIFNGNTYEALKEDIGGFDVCYSNHDYIVTATDGGKVTKKDNTAVTITPDAGFCAYVNGLAFSGGDYALSAEMTNVVFEGNKEDKISSVNYTSGITTSKVSVGYNVNTSFKPSVIVAVYDGNNALVAVSTKQVEPEKTLDDIEVSCNLSSGEKYMVKAMMWNSPESMVPVCAPMSVTIPAAVQ